MAGTGQQPAAAKRCCAHTATPTNSSPAKNLKATSSTSATFPYASTPTSTTRLSHLRDGTNAENVADRAARKRSGNQHTSTSIVGAPRRARYELMTEIRDWVKAHGYERERIATLIAGYDPDAPTLF